MSTTLTPSTDQAVNAANSAIGLAEAAETNPVVKADLQTLFDSYTHAGSIVPGIAALVGMALAQHGITADNFVLTIAVGLAVTGISYVAQWASMKTRKPVVLPKVAS